MTIRTCIVRSAWGRGLERMTYTTSGRRNWSAARNSRRRDWSAARNSRGRDWSPGSSSRGDWSAGLTVYRQSRGYF